MNEQHRSSLRYNYLFGCYLIGLSLCVGFAGVSPDGPLMGKLFSLMVMVTYPVIYLSPILVLTWLFQKSPLGASYRWMNNLFDVCMVAATATVSLVLYADLRLSDLYGFHVNGFVINLLVTPGGIDSLGGSRETFLVASASAAMIYIFHGALFILLRKFGHRLVFPRRLHVALMMVLALLMMSERIIYGVSDFRQYNPVLDSAAILPLYNRVTFRSLLRAFDLEPASRDEIKVEGMARNLHYPIAPIVSIRSTETKPVNIIWIVSESMRWDMLTPEIMPNTSREAGKGWQFQQHYSGGNGTRQGLFSLFYGIYGSYWDSFLHAQRPPVLMDLLRSRGYQFEMFTSADFTYPEFDQTLFESVPASQLHQVKDNDSAWQRDQINTAEITQFLTERDRTKPFMVFMFYESTHARYDFPPESAIRTPYLPDLNYATMTRASLAPRIDELKNRYVNAGHFIDSQLQKIYATLTEEQLWDDTIVMVTGDHGEEFMENGFWGHNSGFSEQQVRTPMVMWIPGKGRRSVEYKTSHMDIIPTILPLLGVTNPVSDYSLGHSLMGQSKPPYQIISDWAGVCYVADGFKFTMPFSSSLTVRNRLFDDADKPVENAIPFLAAHREILAQVLSDARRFSQSE